MKQNYVAHPVSGNVALNLIKAKAWVKWLTESRDRPTSFIAPWITECEIWDDSNPEEREAGLLRCEANIERCDEIWLCGGRISDSMERERKHAVNHGVTVVDITGMGEWPPGSAPAHQGMLIAVDSVPCSGLCIYDGCSNPRGECAYSQGHLGPCRCTNILSEWHRRGQ